MGLEASQAGYNTLYQQPVPQFTTSASSDGPNKNAQPTEIFLRLEENEPEPRPLIPAASHGYEEASCLHPAGRPNVAFPETPSRELPRTEQANHQLHYHHGSALRSVPARGLGFSSPPPSTDGVGDGKKRGRMRRERRATSPLAPMSTALALGQRGKAERSSWPG